LADKPKYKYTTHFKKADLDNIGFSLWTPSVRDWRDVIADYIEISKKRNRNKLAMFKLQVNLLGDIVLVNDTIKGYIKLIEDPEERKSKFPDIDIKEKTIEYWGSEIKSFKIILNALKDIGDGIAWRVLNYNRPLIYNMCVNNTDPGPLTINQGLLTELHSLGDFSNDPEVINFVYHGITNFLLISDLTIVYKNGDINFVEIKSGKNPRGKSWKERLERQKMKVENIVKIGNESLGESSNVTAKFRFVKNKPQTILDKLDTLLKRMKGEPIITQIFNSYLGLGVYNISAIKEDKNIDKLDKLAHQIKKSEKDIIIFPNSMENYIFSPNRAPLSIHPFSSEAIANILLGRYLITYFFNVSQFIREIESKGWQVIDIIYNRKNRSDPHLFSVKKNGLTLQFPPTEASRAIFEGLSVDSIVQTFEDALSKGPIDAEYALFYGYEKEKYLWD